MSEPTCDCCENHVAPKDMTVEQVREINDNVDAYMSEQEETLSELDAQMNDIETVKRIRESLNAAPEQSTVEAAQEFMDHKQSVESELDEYKADVLRDMREAVIRDSAYSRSEVMEMSDDTLSAVYGALSEPQGTLSLPTNPSSDSEKVHETNTGIDPREIAADNESTVRYYQ